MNSNELIVVANAIENINLTNNSTNNYLLHKEKSENTRESSTSSSNNSVTTTNITTTSTIRPSNNVCYSPSEKNDFDSWLEAYQNSVSAELENKPHFENLRKIFINEANLLEELFKPICQHVEKMLKDDHHNHGLRLYNDWGRTKRKEFLLSYYDNEFFRAQYAKNRFLNSARSFMQALALRILPQCAAVEAFLPSIQSVVSIGVGPGSDIAGFIACLRTRGIQQKITYFVLDQCDLWEEFIRVCDRGWSGKFNVSIWFKTARIGNIDSIDLLPDADMIVFSFSNTSLMDPNIWPLLRLRYRLIIVLDGIKEILIEGFSDCQFEKYQLNEKTNLYYTFRTDENTNIPNNR